MTSPLLPVGIAAMGSLAVQTMRKLNPGDFLRELYGTEDKAAASEERETPATVPALPDLAQAVPAFIEQLRARLMPLGIELEQPIVLKDDGWGGVVVDGDHPDRIAIEDLLATDASLRADFHQIASTATAERDRTIAESGSSFGEFRLQIAGDSAAIGFE